MSCLNLTGRPQTTRQVAEGKRRATETAKVRAKKIAERGGACGVIEGDGWETVYQTPPSTDPAVGVTYTYRSYQTVDYWRGRTITIAEVFSPVAYPPGNWARDTNGNYWDFNTGGFLRVYR